ARPLPRLRPGRRALVQRVVRVGGVGGASLWHAGGRRGSGRPGHGGAGRVLRVAGGWPRPGRVGAGAGAPTGRSGLAGGAGAGSRRARQKLLLGPYGRRAARGLPGGGRRAPFPAGGTACPLLNTAATLEALATLRKAPCFSLSRAPLIRLEPLQGRPAQAGAPECPKRHVWERYQCSNWPFV